MVRTAVEVVAAAEEARTAAAIAERTAMTQQPERTSGKRTNDATRAIDRMTSAIGGRGLATPDETPGRS